MLNIENIDFKYDDTIIFKEVSFKLLEGHIYGLTGANGSGKTTLLKCLSCYLQPNNGDIYYNEGEISSNIEYLTSTMLLCDDYYIGMMSISKLVKHLSFKYNTKIDEISFNHLLELMSLSGTSIIRNLSRGNKKVAILCAVLALKPKVLLLDEYLDGIDIVKRKYLKNYLLDYVYEQQAILLLASHTVDDIKDLCDELLLLNNETVQLQEDLDNFKDRYKTYQIVSDNILDKEFFIEKGLKIKQLKSLNNIYWVSILNTDNLHQILEEENFKDLRQIEVAIEEVIYYEFIS